MSWRGLPDPQPRSAQIKLAVVIGIFVVTAILMIAVKNAGWFGQFM